MTATDIKQAARDLGFGTVGISAANVELGYKHLQLWLSEGWHGTMDYMERHAELRRDAATLLPGVQSVIAVTLNYYQPQPEGDNAPKVARYALGRDYHKVLRGKLKALVSQLSPEFEHRICVDSAPALERAYAQNAGLGWFGKNTMLIDSRRGSWFFIGLILTTQPLPPDPPALGGCGTCRACIDACPTGAIKMLSDRYAVDSRLCISYLTIEHKGEVEDLDKLDGWTFGCDVCQEVCPFNQPRLSQPLRAAETAEADFAPRPLPSLPELARMSESDWSKLTEGRALRRAGYDRLTKIAQHQATKPGRPDEPDVDPLRGDRG